MKNQAFDKIIKQLFLIFASAAIVISIYEESAVPMVSMAIGSVAGPIGSMVMGIVTTSFYFYLKA